ncbi:tRNA-guanine transglycosylase, partial [bacterium]
MEFEILKKSKKSKARLGLLKTEHGVVETPAFVGVATKATIKTLSTEDVERTGMQMLIANTFHLHLRPGENIVKAHGGVHKFMGWKRPMMTDSGGFQVFSLGFGTDHGVGKILKKGEERTIEEGMQPQKIKITEKGVEFRSPVDGTKLFLGPKESIAIQEKIGADIILAFDECPSPLADKEYMKKSMERTRRWAAECLKVKKNKNQAIYGIVQGGKWEDLRKECARTISAMPFD